MHPWWADTVKCIKTWQHDNRTVYMHMYAHSMLCVCMHTIACDEAQAVTHRASLFVSQSLSCHYQRPIHRNAHTHTVLHITCSIWNLIQESAIKLIHMLKHKPKGWIFTGDRLFKKSFLSYPTYTVSVDLLTKQLPLARYNLDKRSSKMIKILQSSGLRQLFNALLAISFTSRSECVEGFFFFTLGVICQAAYCLPYLLICGACWNSTQPDRKTAGTT